MRLLSLNNLLTPKLPDYINTKPLQYARKINYYVGFVADVQWY